ncbi:hypothetical protein [Desulfobacter sp.]
MSNNLDVMTFPDKVIPEFFDKIINYYETGNEAQMRNLLNQRQAEMDQAFSKAGDGFFWRLKGKYIIRDFHPLVFFYALGLSLGGMSFLLFLRVFFVWFSSGNIPTINAF